mmetsp:Transcript_10911/g.25312  ORF Transcript_10911/g.25312 Transcript_10911/m.25312 type:complete len:219 (+) Transcript_10911:444-1100(+)
MHTLSHRFQPAQRLLLRAEDRTALRYRSRRRFARQLGARVAVGLGLADQKLALLWLYSLPDRHLLGRVRAAAARARRVLRCAEDAPTCVARRRLSRLVLRAHQQGTRGHLSEAVRAVGSLDCLRLLEILGGWPHCSLPQHNRLGHLQRLLQSDVDGAHRRRFDGVGSLVEARPRTGRLQTGSRQASGRDWAHRVHRHALCARRCDLLSAQDARAHLLD